MRVSIPHSSLLFDLCPGNQISGDLVTIARVGAVYVDIAKSRADWIVNKEKIGVV